MTTRTFSSRKLVVLGAAGLGSLTLVSLFLDGSSRALVDPPAAAAPARILAWNNLGMHCMDPKFDVFALLPPYNTIHAQLIVNGDLVKDATGFTVTYEAVADASGSINKTSSGKTDFWARVGQLFGVSLPVDTGLAGTSMPGASNTPQPMTFDPALHAFTGEGIPITPYDDQLAHNTYPMMRVKAKDAGGQTIASTDIVLPVSDEMTCIACHASTSGDAAKPAGGWVNDPDPTRDYRLNILRLHDEHRQADPGYPTLLAAVGYDAGGLFTTVTANDKAILCAACHPSNALPGSGQPAVKPLTQALHGKHAAVHDPVTQLTLDAVENRAACYLCHPGSVTKCLRGAMGAAVAKDGSMAMQCQDCHGNMSTVGSPDREGWLDEPGCGECHTGTAIENAGKIRFESVFDATGNPHVPADPIFTTNPNVPATGFSLYRFSKGHGGLLCSACHGSTHAEYPSSHANDNVQSIAVQGHVGTISECAACHGGTPLTLAGGPHGMHSIGSSWVQEHGEFAENGGSSGCRACHGADLKGTVLSHALGDRKFNTDFGTKTFWRGFQIGCYACHDGPDSESASKNHAPKVQNAAAQTDADTPIAIPLSATDADGNALTLRVVTQPPYGTAGLSGKTATYFPEASYEGVVKFTFAAWDGKTDSNLGQVTVTVTAGAGCVAVLSTDAADFGIGGGQGAVGVSIAAGCAWVATIPPTVDWISILSGATGNGPGAVEFAVAPNLGIAREATLTIANEPFVVAQVGTDSADLVGQLKNVKPKCDAKCRIKAVLRVTNQGATKAGKSLARIYVSNDAELGLDDVLIDAVAVSKLGPFEKKSFTIDAKVPGVTSLSGRFLFAQLDADGSVPESDETNNMVVFGPLP
jgi:hypothetical protein